MKNQIHLINDFIDKDNKTLAKTIAAKLNIDIEFLNINYEKLKDYKRKKELNILRDILSYEIKDFKDFKIQNDQKKILVFIKKHGYVLKFTFSNKLIINSSAYIFVLWLICLNLVVLLISVLFSKNQIRSILSLTKAADNFGKGINTKDFKPTGAREIRIAGLAFIKMRERIEKQIAKQTQMLAMISHDLRTPLTRLKLQLELLPQSKTSNYMKEDINIMNTLIDRYLNFIQGKLIDEIQEKDISEFFIEYLQQNQQSKTQTKIKGNKFNISLGKLEKKLIVAIDISNFTRVIDNIISNSKKYANNAVISVAKYGEKYCSIDIEDDGPGILKEEREKVFLPFYQTNHQSYQQTANQTIDKNKGSGLGLAIAKEIVNQHKGFIELLDGEKLGGLRVRIIMKLLF